LNLSSLLPGLFLVFSLSGFSPTFRFFHWDGFRIVTKVTKIGTNPPDGAVPEQLAGDLFCHAVQFPVFSYLPGTPFKSFFPLTYFFFLFCRRAFPSQQYFVTFSLVGSKCSEVLCFTLAFGFLFFSAHFYGFIELFFGARYSPPPSPRVRSLRPVFF